MDNDWKLAIGLAALLFGLGFILIFFVGGQVDYTMPGTQEPTGDFLRDWLPKWFFPPPR